MSSSREAIRASQGQPTLRSIPPVAQLRALIPIMREASALTRSVQGALSQIRAVTKSDQSPVTVADFAAQAFVASRLEAIDGAPLKLVGEESSEALLQDQGLASEVLRACQQVWPEVSEAALLRALELGAHDACGDRYWTLDPIDGTKGFLRGQQFAISLALIEEGQVTLGALACPNLSPALDDPLDQAATQGTIYLAALGGGASVVAGAGETLRPVQASGYIDGRVRLCESVEAAHSAHDDSAKILERIARQRVSVRLDSQCKYAVVARGQADLYLRMPTRPGYVERIWDHAAGALVATEAGAKVSDIRGRPLDFSQGKGLAMNKGVICAHPAIHAQTLEAIEALDLLG